MRGGDSELILKVEHSLMHWNWGVKERNEGRLQGISQYSRAPLLARGKLIRMKGWYHQQAPGQF